MDEEQGSFGRSTEIIFDNAKGELDMLNSSIMTSGASEYAARSLY